ncbi:MAG: hypothetical protein ACLRZ4_06010 [Eubacterium ramulus]
MCLVKAGKQSSVTGDAIATDLERLVCAVVPAVTTKTKMWIRNF